MFKQSIIATASAAAVFLGVTHASASATVTLGSERYTIPTVQCNGDPGSFSVQAQVTGGAQLLQFAAFQGDVSTVGFRVGNKMAQAADRTGTFDGTTFRFEGKVQVFTTNALNRQVLRVVATCSNG